MIETLEHILFPFLNTTKLEQYKKGIDNLEIIYSDIILNCNRNEILVFYDANMIMRHIKKSKYLNKENTLKKFNIPTEAINYLKYLDFILSDVRYETYYYFNLKLEKENLVYKSSKLNVTGNNQYLRCDINGLNFRGIYLKFNLLLVIDLNNICELSFYPEKPLWDEAKICPEKDIDKIIDYIINLNVNTYDQIDLKEQ